MIRKGLVILLHHQYQHLLMENHPLMITADSARVGNKSVNLALLFFPINNVIVKLTFE